MSASATQGGHKNGDVYSLINWRFVVLHNRDTIRSSRLTARWKLIYNGFRYYYLGFWANVCKTARPMLSDRCLYACNVGVLWPNGWMDQDEISHGGRPQPWPHCVRWKPSSRSPKGAQPPPIFGPCLLWPNCRPSQLLLSTC